MERQQSTSYRKSHFRSGPQGVLFSKGPGSSGASLVDLTDTGKVTPRVMGQQFSTKEFPKIVMPRIFNQSKPVSKTSRPVTNYAKSELTKRKMSGSKKSSETQKMSFVNTNAFSERLPNRTPLLKPGQSDSQFYANLLSEIEWYERQIRYYQEIYNQRGDLEMIKTESAYKQKLKEAQRLRETIKQMETDRNLIVKRIEDLKKINGYEFVS
jgi:hypothetical protein